MRLSSATPKTYSKFSFKLLKVPNNCSTTDSVAGIQILGD